MELRKGNQTPTASVVIPYMETLGAEAIEAYNKTEKTAQPWQEQLLFDMLGVNDDGLWTHTKFGWSVPRRNGKSEVALIRVWHGLLKGERILYTAHRTATSHSVWERLCQMLEKGGLHFKEHYKATSQFGLETLELFGGGRVNFRTRSSKGGLGEGYDLLVIDEAQEYTDDQEAALKYVVTDSLNPQTIMCGTPPTTTSAGTVFTKYRKNCLNGDSINSGWAEWSVDHLTDCKDREAWYKANPSMGTVFSERSVTDEIGNDEIDFNIQRLGLWVQYNQKSAISKTEWNELKCESVPQFTGDLYAGVKYGQDGTNVCLSVAVKTDDGKVFVESIDCQPIRNGTAWLVDFLLSAKPRAIVIDGAAGEMLTSELKAEGVKSVAPTVREVVVAHSIWEQGLFAQTITHNNQPSLEQAVSNCEKRAIGTNGGFGYRAQREGIEIGLLESAVLAHWACSTAKVKNKQKIGY